MIDGIWSVEIFGMYGWESIGMLALNQGHAVGGGNHHYAVGSYEEDEDRVSISMIMNYRDVPRTLFGEAKNGETRSIDAVCENLEPFHNAAMGTQTIFETAFKWL